MNIPEKDVEIIRDVADHVARTNPVATYPFDDLKQEMTIYGMESYSKWDETKHSHKNESKRDKNLRLFLKDYMVKRIKNLYISVKRNKRAVHVNSVSFDQFDPTYRSLLEVEEEGTSLSSDDFKGMGLSEEEIKVLLYIADNGLVKKKDIEEDLGVENNQAGRIIKSLRGNSTLKRFLEDMVPKPT